MSLQIDIEKAFCQLCLQTVKEDKTISFKLVDSELVELEFLKLDLEKEIYHLYNPQTQMEDLLKKKGGLLQDIDYYNSEISRLSTKITELDYLHDNKEEIIEKERIKAREKIATEVTLFHHEANQTIQKKQLEIAEWEAKEADLGKRYEERRAALELQNKELLEAIHQKRLRLQKKKLDGEIELLKRQKKQIKKITSKLAKELSSYLYFGYFIGKNVLYEWRSGNDNCQLPHRKGTNQHCERMAFYNCYDCDLRFCRQHVNRHDCPFKNKRAKDLQEILLKLKDLIRIYGNEYY